LPLFLLSPLLVVMAVLGLIAALLAIAFLAVAAVMGLSVVFVLHKLGYDHRLLAYLAERGGASPPVKVRIDDVDLPITSTWSFESPRGRPPE
jgi:hypothetical protein